MSNENTVPADDVIVKVEDDTQEQGNTEQKSVAEDTVNEPSELESREGKRSAGSVIAELGNEKKAIAASLVKLAKSSESAREEAKRLLVEDPSIASYMKQKFSEDYSLITGDEPVGKSDSVDLEKIREEERTKAQAEVIREQMQINRDKTIEAKAQELGFTTEEYEQFKRKVEILGSDEQALEDAALIVNSAKALRKARVEIPSGGEADKPAGREVTITSGLSEFADSRNINRSTFATDIDRIKSLHRVDNMGKPVMVLPGL